jgi:hypothetical protein
VCAKTTTGNIWYPTIKSRGRSVSCAKPGAIRKKKAVVWVCGVAKGKKLWRATAPLPPAVLQAAAVVEPGTVEAAPVLESTNVATPSQPVVADSDVLANPAIPDEPPVTAPSTISTTTTIPITTPSTIPGPPMAPGAVTSLNIVNANTSRAELSWGTPTSSGTSEITDYLVTVTSPTGTVTEFNDGVSNDTSALVTDLYPSGATCKGGFTISVSAKSNDGVGPITSVYVYPGRISAPTSLSSVVSDGQIALSWNPPATNHSGSKLVYSLERKSITAGTRFSLYGLMDSTETTFTDTQALNGITWQYRVTATRSDGTGGCYGSGIISPEMPTAK